jgi:hypothetical protein
VGVSVGIDGAFIDKAVGVAVEKKDWSPFAQAVKKNDPIKIPNNR